MQKLALIAVLIVVWMAIDGAASDDGAIVELNILHTNDIHGRFAATDEHGNCGKCGAQPTNRTFGGFGRLLHTIREYRNRTVAALYLDAGDTFTGTTWFAVHRERIAADFMNLLQPDAVCLGNHEFDYGTAELRNYIDAAHFPFVTSNVDVTAEPLLRNASGLRRSLVIAVPGSAYRLGIVGYLTPETKSLAPPNRVRIDDEVPAVNAESARLAAQGIRTIIALGHSGLAVDRRIAAECPLVDLVIGGHDNAFLWNGPAPGCERPVGPYPLVVRQPRTGKRVPVVQAYAFAKYLGILNVRIRTGDGRLVGFSGQPLLLDGGVASDAQAERLLDRYRPGVGQFEARSVGRTAVGLRCDCRTRESNLGNLVCDAMVQAFEQTRTGPADDWTDAAALAVYQSGGLSHLGAPPGALSEADLMQLLPYDDGLFGGRLSGDRVRRMLERSVERCAPGVCWPGEFVQVSAGFRVVFDTAQAVGRRVREVWVWCGRCSVPRFERLADDVELRVIVGEHMRNGGDGYGAVWGNASFERLDGSIRDALRSYVKQMQVVYPAVEGRLRFVGESSAEMASDAARLRCSGAIIVLLVGACVRWRNMSVVRV